MIDRRMIEQLDSPDPAKRKAAIQQLARTKDMDAIRYLEAAERSDSDASVRDIARKAIVFIKKHNEEDNPISGPGSASAAAKPEPKSRYAAGSIMAEYANQPQETYSSYDEPMEPQGEPEPPKPKLVAVPEARQRNAKSALDMAGRAAFNEENGRAAKYLVEAFKQNPNLQFDAYAVGLAATVTGLYKTDAVKAVMDGSVLELFDKTELTGKKKRVDPSKNAEEELPPAGWGTAIVDLLMYGLINALIVGTFVIVIVQIIVQAVQNDPTIQDALAQQQLTFSGVIDQIIGLAILSLVIYVLVYGLFMILGLLVQSFLIHVIARMVLGGDGTLPNLIHRTALFLGIMAALIGIVQVGGLFLPIITDPALGIAIWGLGLFLSIYTFMGYSSRVGKVYDMGAGKGCLAIFLSSVVIGIFGVACVVLLAQAQLAAFGNVFVTVGP